MRPIEAIRCTENHHFPAGEREVEASHLSFRGKIGGRPALPASVPATVRLWIAHTTLFLRTFPAPPHYFFERKPDATVSSRAAKSLSHPHNTCKLAQAAGKYM